MIKFARLFNIFSLRLACVVSIISAASCSPISQDRFYQETKLQNTAGTAKPGDIVGRWYDAWDWNGHHYTTLREFKKDGTGTEVEFIKWRTGGGLKAVSDLRWNATGNGVWTVVASNKRTLAGSGRFSTKPFTSTMRILNKRLYDDTRKRTSVDAQDTSAVADKNLDMQWAGEARTARNQQIQELGQAIDDLRSAL